MKRTTARYSTLFALVSIALASPPVRVSLRSSWSAPPFLVEAIETFALENPDSFFPLIDAVTNPDVVPPAHTMSPEAARQVVLGAAQANGLLLEPGAESFVDMNLALHAATPKIEAFYHHYASLGEGKDPKCGSWVEWYGQAICDIETLAQLTSVDTIDSKSGLNSSFVRPKTFTFDHIYPPRSRTLQRPPRTAILYASFGSKNFRELHEHLIKLASSPNSHVEYVLRHIPTEVPSKNNSYLSGYGVALDLKKMEYSAVDDRFKYKGSAEKTTEDEEEAVDIILSQLPESSSRLDPATVLSEAEIYDVGLQATQFIASSNDSLRTLSHLSQNFPKYAAALARGIIVTPEVETEVATNVAKAQAGANVMWLNGAVVQDHHINPFGLLSLLHKERTNMAELTKLGLSPGRAVELMTHPAVSASQSQPSAIDGLFDASDRPEGEGLILWWNDIEKDDLYARWPTSIHTILRPTYPGQLPSVRRNLFNVVLVMDLANADNIYFLTSAVANLIGRGFPLHFGLVPMVESEDAIKMARTLYYLAEHKGVDLMGKFLQHLAITRVQTPEHLQRPGVDWKVAREWFNQAKAELPDMLALDAVTTSLDHEARFEKAKAYATRLGADAASSPRGHAFLNGKHLEVDDNLLRVMQADVGSQLVYLQEKVYTGEVKNDENFSTYFYDLPTTLRTRNRYIFPSTSSPSGGLRISSLPNLLAHSEFPISSAAYLHSPRSDEIFTTIHLVADLDSPEGIRFVKEAIEFLSTSRSRITFVHNPSNTDFLPSQEQAPNSWLFSHLISKGLLSKQRPPQLLRVLGFSEPDTQDEGQAPLSSIDLFKIITDGVLARDFDSPSYAKFVTASRFLLREWAFESGTNGVVVNGRIIGPIEPGKFLSSDFAALEMYEYTKRFEPIITALKEVQPSLVESDRGSVAHTVAMAASVIASMQIPDPSEVGMYEISQRPRMRSYEKLDGTYTSFSVGNRDTAIYQFAVLLDPLSEAAQKWSGLLEWVLAVPDVSIQVYLNPSRTKELPLKRFYRNCFPSSLEFNADGVETPIETIFSDLPVDPTYTLAMDVSSSWLVRPREAAYDLDNIQLQNLSPEHQSSGVVAIFALDYLVIEGHARDKRTQSPPRGLQLQLVEAGSAIVDDTQVVANLGYFQFKAKPGIFRLEIRNGRGRDIFEIESVGNEGWDSPTLAEAGDTITLTSFSGLTLYPRFVRRPGMESADVLDDSQETNGEKGLFSQFVSSVTSLFGSKDPQPDIKEVANRQADINIFTVASGLLYERFAAIMILSVMRNTNSTVKFWFIENFLSPSFLEFIPHLAKEYNFQYELVTYKWPSWLRAQKEKQRIIWAYKILFLDVLFPMDLKKVIFVDADQIVRADLQELVDLDLQGAPYGYTPMGDDNTDMEGFRFWKTGYWKDFLRGKPYHISALYVVDLVKFRQMAAGDILRGQYQALSADPNSLANLDQDLPNNLQREVPIFSLHEDWLWCETWCSKDRLHRAKTIDLCQNPLTKEPKLARARAIPEWEEYDSEIARFAQKLSEHGLLQAGIVGEGVDNLAGARGRRSESQPAAAEESTTAPHDEL